MFDSTTKSRKSQPQTLHNDIRVIKITPLHNAGALKALANVMVGPWLLRGCRVIRQSGQRPFCQLPHAQGKTGQWWPVIQCKDPNLDGQIKDAILAAWLDQEGGAQ